MKTRYKCPRCMYWDLSAMDVMIHHLKYHPGELPDAVELAAEANRYRNVTGALMALAEEGPNA